MIYYLVHPTPLRPLLIVDSGRGISQVGEKIENATE